MGVGVGTCLFSDPVITIGDEAGELLAFDLAETGHPEKSTAVIYLVMQISVPLAFAGRFGVRTGLAAKYKWN
jgi:hypothetical protein